MLGAAPQSKARKQILRDIYEENLVVVGKKKRPVRIINPQRKTSRTARRHPTFYFLLLMISAIIAYTAIITFWGFSRGDLNRVADAEDVATASGNHLPDMPVNAGPAQAKAKASSNEASGPQIKAIFASEPGEAQMASAEPVATPASKSIDDVIYHAYAQPQPSSPQDNATPETINQLKTLMSPGGPQLARLFGLGVHTIVIDPGHGGKDPGAIGHQGTEEKDVTLEIAKRLRDRLKANENYHVLLTRESDEFLSLSERVKYANDNHADLFVSIHINYFPGDQLNFVETYYFGPNNDNKVVELAAKENADSQYLYTEFKDMVEKIGDTMKFQESRDLAESVQTILFPQIRKVNKKAKDHGIKPGPFVVLLGIDAPSILTEVTSLSNKQEEQRLKSPAYRDKIAAFLEKGIVNYLNKSTNSPGGERNGNGEEKEKLAQAHND